MESERRKSRPQERGDDEKDEYLVEFLLEWRRVDLSEHVLGTKSLNAIANGVGGESGLLLLVCTDTLVHLLKRKTSLPDFGVLIVVLRNEVR